MRAPLLFPILLIALACDRAGDAPPARPPRASAARPQPADVPVADYARRLAGTWRGDVGRPGAHDRIAGTDTYNADGTGASHWQQSSPDYTGPVDFAWTWRADGATLRFTVTATNVPRLYPVGMRINFRVNSFTDAVLVVTGLPHDTVAQEWRRDW